MRSSRSQLAAVGLVALLALAGCAPDPAPTQTTVPETPSPTPTATEEPVALEPESTLPLDCSDMLSLAYIQDRIPGETLRVSVDESSTPNGQGWAGFVTAGGLRCVWGGDGRTDGGYDQGLSLAILGYAASEFDAWTAYSVPSGGWTKNAFGDESVSYCDGYWQNGCYGGMVVDGYWVDFAVRDSAPRAEAVARTRLAELLTPVVTAIRAAGDPRPAWTPPTTAYRGDELCSDASVASTALGSTATIAPLENTSPDIVSVGFERAGVARCLWKTGSGAVREVAITMFPGGAWIYPRMAAEPGEAAPGYFSDAVAASVTGVDGALIAQADGVWSAMSTGGSLIVVMTTSTYEPSDLLPVLQRIADHVAT